MTTPELLPCPLCGDNRASTYHVRDGRVSMCPACGAKSGSQFNGPLDLPSADDRAIAAWNRRTTSPELAALRAQVERLTGALGRAQRALKPFADRVFNDNGDCTISDTHTLTPPDYWNAQSAERIALAALAEGAAP